MLQPRSDQPVGLLNYHIGATRFDLARYYSSPDLSFFIEHYWRVRWDLRGQPPYMSENLPHPCVNLVIEREQSGIFGLVTGKFAHYLEEEGSVFAAKFRPGAFYPFLKQPVASITDKVLPLCHLFGSAGNALEAEILALDDDAARVQTLDAFLCAHLPQPDEQISHVNQIIDSIAANRAITHVDELVKQINLSKRTLQRLFHHYVGVSPKWVIKRFRLHEAAEKIAAGTVTDWPRLALELGYFDQAHFIRDFKAVVGMTPAAYAKTAQRKF